MASAGAALALRLCAASAADAAPPVDPRVAQAEIMKQRAALPDTPGTGRFPAMKEEAASLADHVIYRPAHLDQLGSTKLGVYVFGNGACSNDGASARLHLLEVASHGYLAIASGRIRTGPGATVPPVATPAPAPAKPGDAPRTLPTPPTTSAGLTSAIDWALRQNEDPKSPYFKKIDPKAVAVSGYSCGALQALEIAQDRRIKTVVVMNSGIVRPGTMSTPIPGMGQQKSLLETLHTPTLYILGGETDIAYANGVDDFERIDKVPVFLGNVLNVGHGGTYWERNGGKAATAVVAWLDWQLRNDPKAAKTFVGKDCGLCTDAAWSVRKKRID
jgi:hypothetical protein